MKLKNVFTVNLILMALLSFNITQVYGMEPMVKKNSKVQGGQAPDFLLSDTKGGKYQLSTDRDGKAAILFFWATWCPHCRTQIKELQANKAEIESKNIQMLPINLGENKKQVDAYLSQNKLDLKILLDESGEVGELYDVLGLPTFIFINPEGVISGVSHHLPENLDDVF